MGNDKIIKQEEVKKAWNRIKKHIYETPLVSSNTLNEFLGHKIYFKAEPFQKTGSFKIRGAFNCLLEYKERNGKFPKRIVAFSTGNHGQGLSFACKKLGISDVTIYMTKNASKLKKQAIQSYGGKISIHNTRKEIYKLIEKEVEKGAYNIPTSDNEMVVAGQGTALYEVLKEDLKFNSVFCPCGSGGLVAGTYVASHLFKKRPQVFAVEPKFANKVSRSIKKGYLFSFSKEVVKTIADGARTPFVSERVFEYIKNIDGIYEAEEEDIIYWTQWLSHLLKISIEPTSAMAMAGCISFLKTCKKPQSVLVILSGGNMSVDTRKKIYKKDFLKKQPSLN